MDPDEDVRKRFRSAVAESAEYNALVPNKWDKIMGWILDNMDFTLKSAKPGKILITITYREETYNYMKAFKKAKEAIEAIERKAEEEGEAIAGN